MRVNELMTPQVVTIDETATCHDAVQLMVRHHIRHLPVASPAGTLRGIVTDRDVRHFLFGPGVFAEIGRISLAAVLCSVKIAEVMSVPAVHVEANAELAEAARLMAERKLGALPVVEHDRLVGIITETDLLRHIVGSNVCCPDVETIVVSWP